MESSSLVGEVVGLGRLLLEATHRLESLARITGADLGQAVNGGAVSAPKPKTAAKVASTKRPSTKPRKRSGDVNSWDAGSPAARRVPSFVQEMTGLDTKKAIVAKYGPATFKLGEVGPKPLAN